MMADRTPFRWRHRAAPRGNAGDWEKLSGFCRRKVVRRYDGFAMVEYVVPGRSVGIDGDLLFFSDLHWAGDDALGDRLIAAINDTRADWVAFGGDLITHVCFLEKAMAFLARVQARRAKIAVMGNWDARRRQWFPFHIWRRLYDDTGFNVLIDESQSVPPLRFTGLSPLESDPRPRLPVADGGPAVFDCLVAHNPDRVIAALDNASLSRFPLVLCGHTHGGQIRVPFFGALRTSSRFWKKFEYGLYRNRQTDTRMIVTNGIGYTGVNARLFCLPEIIRIRFT